MQRGPEGHARQGGLPDLHATSHCARNEGSSRSPNAPPTAPAISEASLFRSKTTALTRSLTGGIPDCDIPHVVDDFCSEERALLVCKLSRQIRPGASNRPHVRWPSELQGLTNTGMWS